MVIPGQISHVHEIFTDASHLDKCTLVALYSEIYVRGEMSGHDFCEELGKDMDQANWSKIANLLCPLLLGQEDSIGIVKEVQLCRAQIVED